VGRRTKEKEPLA